MKKNAMMSAAVLAAMAGLGASAFGQCATLEFGSTPNAAELGEVDAGITGDDLTGPISLPFAVSLYGNAYTSLIASSNGTLQFVSNSASLGNVCPLPAAVFAGGPTIMAHWDDLRTDDIGGSGRGIFTSVSGAPGSQRFNIEYRASLFRSNTENVNFIVSFYENQNYYDVFYVSIAQDGNSATAGVQANGTAGSSQTTLSCNAANLTSGTSYRFFCPSTFNPSVVLTTDLSTGIIGTSFVASAAVTSGQPVSAITGVSLDASAVDAGSITMLDNGVAPDGVANDGIYSAAVTVGNNSAFGAQTLTATATDALGRTGAGISTFTVSAGNDDCVGAVAILDGTTPVNNLDAATTTPACGGSNDVWFSYVATFTGTIEASTCGNRDFDTVLAVYDSCPESGGVSLDCNDDTCGLGSTISWQGVQGQTYYIRFAGFGGQRGNADLTIGNPAPTNPTAFGTANPDPVPAGSSTLLEVTVTPGENPTSTGITVSVDTSALIGGSSGQTMYDDGTNGDLFAGDNVFSYLQNVDASQSGGTVQLFYVVGDAEGRSANGSIFLDVTIPAQWEELANGGGDAGDLPSSAQTPTGTDPFFALGGNIESSSDADMFLISICDVASFNATTVGNGTTGDTQLFLFDSNGLGVTSNDDSQATAQSTITGQFVPSAGNYYIAISTYNLDPVDETGQLIWNNTPFGTERAPDGPGAFGAVAGWTGTFAGTGNYQVTLAGTCFAGGTGPSCDYDFNQDENVDLLDAQQMAQVFVGLISPEANWLDGDLNGDENADLTDAQILAAYVVTGQCNL